MEEKNRSSHCLVEYFVLIVKIPPSLCFFVRRLLCCLFRRSLSPPLSSSFHTATNPTPSPLNSGDDSAQGKQLYIAMASIGLIGLCAYPVFGSSVRPGHELFSSEKPEAIRESEELKRKEYRRLMKQQKQQMMEEQEAWAKK